MDMGGKEPKGKEKMRKGTCTQKKNIKNWRALRTYLCKNMHVCSSHRNVTELNNYCVYVLIMPLGLLYAVSLHRDIGLFQHHTSRGCCI